MNAGLLIRISNSALVFAATAGWYFLAPRRAWAVGRPPRLPNNPGILIVDVLAPGTITPIICAWAWLGSGGAC